MDAAKETESMATDVEKDRKPAAFSKIFLEVDEFGIGQAGKYSNGESHRRNSSF